MVQNQICQMDRVLLEEYVENLLNQAEKLLVEQHVKQCAMCRKELNELKLLSWELNHLAENSISYPKELGKLCDLLVNEVSQKPVSLKEIARNAYNVPKQAVSTVFGFTKALPLSKGTKKLGKSLMIRKPIQKQTDKPGLLTSLLSKSKQKAKKRITQLLGGT